jgi:hypothetical protein
MFELTSQKKGRKISAFVFKELLYSYMLGDLDKERKLAMDEYVRDNKDAQIFMAQLVAGQKYCSQVGKTTVNPKFLLEVARIKGPMEEVASWSNWRQWPAPVQWCAEAMVAAVVVGVLVIVVPWNQLGLFQPMSSEIKLAQEKPIVVDDKTPLPKETAPVVATTTSPVAPAVLPPPPTETKVVAAAPAKNKPGKIAAVVAQQTSAPVSDPKSGDQPLTAKNKPGIPQGLLFGFDMEVVDAQSIAMDVKAKIEDLGGKKAGQVELGWPRPNPKGNYYHFTMPEIHYQDLVTALNGYAPLKISKNPHDRVMPPGQIRVILFIKDK